MKVYCNNKECKHYKSLEKPVPLRLTKFRVPFGDDLIEGECSINPIIQGSDFISHNFKCLQPMCLGKQELKGFCSQEECLWNDEEKCTREELFIDKSLISKRWICRCFSHRSISGHTDWSRNLNSDGTPKGGHVDDNYGNKLDKDNKSSKSFSDHMRQRP